MTEEKTLPQRMREAADTIEEARADRVQRGSPSWPVSDFVATDLRNMANRWEAEDAKPKYGEIRVIQDATVAVYIKKPDGGYVAVYLDPIYPSGVNVRQDVGTAKRGDLVWEPK